MTPLAIRVENLSKLYHIGRARQRHDTLRDALVDLLPRISRINTKSDKEIRKIRDNSWQKESDDTLWALKDVSFEVQRGEVVGVIGRNGAGKIHGAAQTQPLAAQTQPLAQNSLAHHGADLRARRNSRASLP